MKNNLKSILFIWKYISKYWKSLIIVSIFIFISTYFQILGPRLLGQSIDDMSQYVISQVGKNAIDDLNDKILNEKKLTDNEEKELLKITDGKKLSSKELKEFWEMQLFLKDVISIDKKRITEGKGFSQKQLDEILVSATDKVVNYQLDNKLTIKQAALDVAVLTLANRLY